MRPINRIITDSISSLLFCSSMEGIKHLKNEGIHENVFDVGDVMYDAFIRFSEVSKAKSSGEKLIQSLDEKYSLATIHRPSNTDSLSTLNAILSAFSKLPYQIVWPVHPRNKDSLNEIKIPDNLILADPQPYFSMNALLRNCERVFTDSGGLQKEAYWAKKPCITLREETEWVETLAGNWNQLAGNSAAKILEAESKKPFTQWTPIYGQGRASVKIAEEIKRFLGS